MFFVKDILEEHDFTVEIREDNLIARVENHEKDYMKKRLVVLGYMSLHTRQLDMIMQNDASVNYYRSKIRKDISDLVHSSPSHTLPPS